MLLENIFISASVVIMYCRTSYTRPIPENKEITRNTMSDLEKLETVYKKRQSPEDQGNEANHVIETSIEKIRVKRAEGENKFVDVTKSTPMKLLRLFLQMFKNAVVGNGNDIGGAHPMSHKAPKGVVILFKNVIVDFFFPEIGTESPTGLDKK